MPSQISNSVLVDLSRWSHIKIGSKNQQIYLPADAKDLQILLKLLQNTHLTPLPLGGGSNILFGDTTDYAIISDRHLPRFWRRNGKYITVSANYNITQLIMDLAKINIGGLEFLSGIPAHLGGLCKMNAGAYGFSFSEFLHEVKTVNWQGKLLKLKKEDISFAYRYSSLPGFILEITLRLPELPENQIKKKVQDIIQDRKKKQPLNLPNLGSVFKNPPHAYAGSLLEETGFKGKSSGLMAFSNLHANFLVNRGGGSFQDALFLIEKAVNAVKRKFDIILTPEIEIIN